MFAAWRYGHEEGSDVIYDKVIHISEKDRVIAWERNTAYDSRGGS